MNTHSIIIDSKILDIINTASEYRHIKRVGIFGCYTGNELYAGSDFRETDGLELIYDSDETGDGAAEELLEYIEDADMLLRHITGVSKIGFICLKDIAEFRETASNGIIWIYNRLQGFIQENK